MSNSRGSNAKFNLERIVEKVSNNIKNEESENFYYKEVSNQEETPLIQNQVSIKVGDEGFKPQLSPPQYLSDQDGINACLSECGDNVIASDENNNKIADTKKFKKKMSSNAGIIENTSCGEKRSQDSHHATDDNIGRSRTSRRPKSRSSSRRRKSSSLSTQSSKGSKQKLERKGLETNLEEQRIKSIISQKGERKERPTQEQLSLGSRAGGVYIPPARLRAMQAEIKDKSSKEYQRLTWDALKKSLNGLINKINVSNIKLIIPELFGENLIRGRGLFARSTIIAQRQSPMFTPVYAATVAIVNTKLPEVGGLIISRLICNFRNAFRRNDKQVCMCSIQFLAHLINQRVAHQHVGVELLFLLLQNPTDHSVEVAIAFLKEVGAFLTEESSKIMNEIFERLRAILHEGEIDKRVQYMIETMFAIRKDKYKDHPTIPDGLDLVEEEDQITHLLSLNDEDIDPQDILDVFSYDPSYLENEEQYRKIKAAILGDEGTTDAEGTSEGETTSGEESPSSVTEEDQDKNKEQILDMTQSDLVHLRRTIYLTIMSSKDFEEVIHKLLKNTIQPGMEEELGNMIIECCSMERSYLKFYGAMAQRLCELSQVYQKTFEKAFEYQYLMIHHLENNKLRNVTKLCAHLLHSDAIPWTVLECIHLNEEETTPSSRIFIKILFQELAEHMGLVCLNDRLNDPFLKPYFAEIFPQDHPRKTKFANLFFSSIGLGWLTEGLREFLKAAPLKIMEQRQSSLSDSTSSSSSSGSSSSSDSSSGADSDSDSDSDSTASTSSSASTASSSSTSSDAQEVSSSPDSDTKTQRSRGCRGSTTGRPRKYSPLYSKDTKNKYRSPERPKRSERIINATLTSRERPKESSLSKYRINRKNSNDNSRFEKFSKPTSERYRRSTRKDT